MSEVIDYMNTDKAKDSKIMVIGVGGGGGNAVKYMYDIGVHNVYFMVCNTDAQALQKSPIPQKIQLGGKLTKGLGAGNKPEKGREAALESVEEIKECFVAADVEMVFITAGMGGGTGTGAAPVIAQVAKELGILTVGIVTIPFRIEGPMRLRQACKGLEELEQHVDSMIVIDNENICKMYGDLDFSDAFSKADDILTIAAKGIAETITKEHRVNVDFADVFTTMSNSGVVLLGYASSDINSENVAIELTEQALLSPLLNQNNVYGAEKILINISWNQSELKMGQLHAIIKHIQAAAGSNANIIWGAGVDETLDDNEVSLIIIATGFPSSSILGFLESDIEGIGGIKKEQKKVETKEELASKTEDKKLDDTDQSKATTSSNSQPVETEYVTLDDEPIAKNETESREKASEEDSWVVLSTNDESESSNKEKNSTKQPLTPSTNRSQSLFDSIQEIDIKSSVDSHKENHQKREYTVDELDNMPAYIRRNIVAQLNQKLSSNDKTSLELDE